MTNTTLLYCGRADGFRDYVKFLQLNGIETVRELIEALKASK